MISNRRDAGGCGKGAVAENSGTARVNLFGRGEKIDATVTDSSVLRYWIF